MKTPALATFAPIHVALASVLALASATPGCSTYGVEYEDHILTTSSTAPDIALFEIDGMATDGVIRIQGGAEDFAGEMRVTGWFEPGVDHDIFDYISLYFDSHDGTLTPRTLFHSQEVEHITVREAIFDVRSSLDVWAEAAAGGVTVDSIIGNVTVNAPGDVAVAAVTGEVAIDAAYSSVSASDVDGPVFISGGWVTVANTGPVDIIASADVDATIAYGGIIDTSSTGDVTVDVLGTAFELLDLSAVDGDITVYLPAGSGWIIDIAGGHTAEDEDDDDGDVTVDVGDVYYSEAGYVSEVFTIGAGGPTIFIRGGWDITVIDY